MPKALKIQALERVRIILSCLTRMSSAPLIIRSTRLKRVSISIKTSYKNRLNFEGYSLFIIVLFSLAYLSKNPLAFSAKQRPRVS